MVAVPAAFVLSAIVPNCPDDVTRAGNPPVLTSFPFVLSIVSESGVVNGIHPAAGVKESTSTRLAGNVADSFAVVISSPLPGFTYTRTLTVSPGANDPEFGMRLNVAALATIGNAMAMVKIEYKAVFMVLR
jgi:hypothetical protein